ncbi:transcription factor TFIIIB component B'' homolog isoform X2 [Betta splendens]|uniref:Transcription factor TFIIIB component B'' homolog isoform X2 n=1 Tax=Betta splendens TaxID=158456 RepID=A0A6P7P6M8_BETSP|nr:transcription factor TFIIIB component B'' homolog isoform X2 [Betta splendens]
MFRRSRFSVRPNVGTGGRAPAAPQEAPSANQDPKETSRDVAEGNSGPAVTDDKSVVTPEKNAALGDGNDQNGEGGSSSAALQRRKRFSVKPKVAPGRLAPLARAAKSPVKPVSEIAVEASGSDIKKMTTSSQASPTAASPGLRSPRRRRPSEDIKQAKVQPKPTHVPPESKAASAVPPAENSLKPADSGQQLESTSGSQVKEAPPRVPFLIPDKEALELSEKAKTLVSSKSKLSLSPSALSLSRLLNDPSDLQRLAKAQKLKELLREERHKEKKRRKAKTRLKEFTLDPTKMTMRDLLHYVPLSNPMSSSLENSTQEEETVIPASPGSTSPERAQQPDIVPKIMSPREEEDEEADEEGDEGLMVPQVKVAEDGSLIIDEESLTVEVQRAKGPNPVHDRDPIFERGSTTTYSSFRKGTCSKPWCSEETDMFFLAISMVGTDFSMICQLFPHRARAEIKNKFKKEERQNAWRIDKAFRERRKLDIEYFSKLLEKIMEVQQNRKKLKSLAEKPPRKRKAKGRKSAKKLSDVEEEGEEDENLPDLEDEEGGGKENELLCNEGEATASKPIKQLKRKTGEDTSRKEPRKKRSKKGEKSSDQDEPDTPQDTEAALPEDPKNSDNSLNGENTDAKDTAVTPAKLSRGRAPKPLLPLGRKLGKKVPPPSTKAKESADENLTDANSKKVNEAASKSSANEENSSDDDQAPVAPPKPTRYGRVPKPTKPVSEPASSSPVQQSPPAAKPKPKCTAKRGRSSAPESDQESKKPRLVTLRASQSDESDEENGQQWEQEEGEEELNPACSPIEDSTAPAFVPASLRSPQAKISMVEETMEELDILANIPDVLGISQVALCPDASCEEAHNETCDHQLDLLVDVIDFLSSEHTEGTEEESYNEAAQTLLTIGNLYSQDQADTEAHVPAAGTTSNNETSATEEQQADNGDNDQICDEQWTSSDPNPVPHLQSSTESLEKSPPQTVLDLELCQPPKAESQFEPSFEQANQERGSTSSQAEVTESKSSSTAPGKSVTESQLKEGLNTDSAPNQKDGHQSAAFIGSSEEDLPVSHEAQSEIASSQPKRSRMQKVKPNLPPTCRAARSKPQATKSPIPKPVAEVEPEPSCATPSEKSTENTGLVSDLKPPLNLGTTEEQPKAEEKNLDKATFGQVDLDAATSGGNSSGHKIILEDNFQLSNEDSRTFSVSASTSTNEKTMAYTTESGSNVESPEMSHRETVEEGLNTDTVLIQDKGDQSDVVVKSAARDLPVSQEAQGEVASPLQPRRSRMQKVKPNLPLTCRTARSKPQVTKASEGKLIESTAPVSDLSESQDLSSSLPPTDEGKKTDHAMLGQNDSGAAGGSSVGNLQPRSEQTGSASESTTPTSLGKDLPVSQKVVISESSKDIMAEVEDQSTGTAEKSSQSSSTAVSVPSLESSIKTEEQKTAVGFELDSSSESSESSVAHRRRRSVKVKPKPNLTSSIKASRTKLPPKGTCKTPDQQQMNTPSSEMEEQQSEHASTVHSEPEPTEKEGENRMSVHLSVNTQPLDSVKAAAAEMETSLDCTGDKDASSVLASTQVAEICSLLTAAAPEKGSGETSTGDKMSSNTEVEVKGGSEVDVSTGATELKTQPPDSAEFSSFQILEKDRTKSEINSASTTKLDKEENKSQAAAEQASKTTEVSQSSDERSQSAHSTDESQLESSGSTFTNKARPARRGRLIKPKPNLARSSQLPRVQPAQNEAQADCSTSKVVDASVSHEAVRERRPEKEPAGGAAEQESRPEPHSGAAAVQLGQPNPPSHDAESSLGCLTQVPPTQSVPTSSAEGTQSRPCLPLFSDMLLEQVPSDPDEPFFILSLTEIPVSSSGEVVDSAAEPLSYLPVTDASIPQLSGLPGEQGEAAAGDASASGVPVLTSTEQSGETSSININDSGRVLAAHEKDSTMEHSVDVEQASPTVQSPKTVENNNDSTSTSTKLRPRGTGRKAKIPVKPTKGRTKQSGKALVPDLTPTVEPNACDATANAGDEVTTESQTERGDQVETRACGSEASTARARRRTSIPAPAKAASSISKVKAPRRAGQRSSTTPRNVAPAQSPQEVPSSPQTQRRAERSTTPTAGCCQSPEVTASRESDCVQISSAEEEPTSVSQYFLSDIFTDVAEV